MAALAPTLNQMLILFLCIMVGFALNRSKVLPENADVVISKMLNNAFIPALVLQTFQRNCTAVNLTSNAGAILYNVLFLAIGIAAACLLAPRFSKRKEDTGIWKYAITVTNFGFMGNALVLGLLGEQALFRYMIFTIPTNVFTYTLGIVWLSAGKEKLSPKLLINPMFAAMALGTVMGLTGISFPGFAAKAVESCAACFSPLAMVLTGFVIGKFNISSLIKRADVYILTGIRVVMMPLMYMLLCRLIHVPEDVRQLVLIYAAMPLGLNTIVFPAAYGGDETIGASMAVVSNVIGLVTVPLMMQLI